MLHSVIMAGGSGTRFWPLSNQACPKQFLRLIGEESLIQQAWRRAAGLTPAEQLWIVASGRHEEQIRAHLPEAREDRILLEPLARNTAPAIGWTARHLCHVDPDAIMLVMPADHVVEPVEQFHNAVRLAVRVIEDDPRRLVLFGVVPTHPATGYGYIECGAPLEFSPAVQNVIRFREKPNLATAQQFVAGGRHLWNSGIFVWKARRILEALQAHQPELAAALERLPNGVEAASSQGACSPLDLLPVWEGMPSISIDHAVLEQEQTTCVIPVSFTWDDVGSWESLSQRLPADERGNVVVAAGGTCLPIDTGHSILCASPNHVLVTSGLEDCLIVQTPGVTLVARRGDPEAMRKIVELLKSQGLDHVL